MIVSLGFPSRPFLGRKFVHDAFHEVMAHFYPSPLFHLHSLTVQHPVRLELSTNSHPLRLRIPCFFYPWPIPFLVKELHSLYNISLVRTLSIRGILCCGCPEQLCNNSPSFIPSYTCVYSSVCRLILCIPFSFLQLATVHPSLPHRLPPLLGPLSGSSSPSLTPLSLISHLSIELHVLPPQFQVP